MICGSKVILKASVSTFSIGAEKPFRIFFTRLRRHAPCGSTGRNDDRRPRRSPQGEAGFASAQFSSPPSGCPAEEREELNCIPGLLDDFPLEPKGFELLPRRKFLTGRVAVTQNGKSVPKKVGIPCLKANKKNNLRTFKRAQSLIR
jgi:hypothetical protein